MAQLSMVVVSTGIYFSLLRQPNGVAYSAGHLVHVQCAVMLQQPGAHNLRERERVLDHLGNCFILPYRVILDSA